MADIKLDNKIRGWLAEGIGDDDILLLIDDYKKKKKS